MRKRQGKGEEKVRKRWGKGKEKVRKRWGKDKEKSIKVTVKVQVSVREHPKVSIPNLL